MRTLQKIFWILCLAAITGSTVSCGRVSAPSPVEGSGYPHNYPADRN